MRIVTLHLLSQQMQILGIIFSKYGSFECLVQVAKLIYISGYLFVLLNVVEFVLTCALAHLLFTYTQFEFFDRLSLKFLIKTGVRNWIDDGLYQDLTSTRLRRRIRHCMHLNNSTIQIFETVCTLIVHFINLLLLLIDIILIYISLLAIIISVNLVINGAGALIVIVKIELWLTSNLT